MTNICIFNGDMSRGGGTEKITQILANSLVEFDKYNIYVLNLNNSSNKSNFHLNEKIIFYTLDGEKITKKIFELYKFLRKNKIDIIIDVDIMLGIYSLPATFLYSKAKLISWEMFNIRNDIGSKHTNLIRKICLNRSAYYINQSKGDMDSFIKEMPVKCPITYIYNPIDINMNYTSYDEKSKIIVTAGHFFKTKGYDLAVEVAKIVFDLYPDWCWKFYGDGKEMETISKKVKEYGIEKNIIFCGRTNNMANAYKEAAMYVMTSRTEGFGLVLTEAKSYNLPTLAYDVDFGPREIIDNGISGFLVPAFDTKQMAEKICLLIEDSKLRKKFSLHSKDNCNKFAKEMFIQRWLEVFNEVERNARI